METSAENSTEKTEKVYKSSLKLRIAVKRHRENTKVNNPDKYNEMLNYHRAYNKQYYRKMKEDRAKLSELIQMMNQVVKI